MNSFENNNQHQSPKVKTKKSILFKIAITIIVAIIVIVSAMFLAETRLINNYKYAIQEFLNDVFQKEEESFVLPFDKLVTCESLDQLQEWIPFDVPLPLWVPDGYEIKRINFKIHSEDYYYINYDYYNIELDSGLGFSINTYEYVEIIPERYTIPIELVNINEIEVLVATGNNDVGTYYIAEYINNQGHRIFIGDTNDKATLIQIIENMSVD